MTDGSAQSGNNAGNNAGNDTGSAREQEHNTPAAANPPASNEVPPGGAPASHGADDASAPVVKPYGQTGTTGLATPVREGESVLDGTTADISQATAVTKAPDEILPGEDAPATAGRRSSHDPAPEGAGAARPDAATAAAAKPTPDAPPEGEARITAQGQPLPEGQDVRSESRPVRTDVPPPAPGPSPGAVVSTPDAPPDSIVAGRPTPEQVGPGSEAGAPAAAAPAAPAAPTGDAAAPADDERARRIAEAKAKAAAARAAKEGGAAPAAPGASPAPAEPPAPEPPIIAELKEQFGDAVVEAAVVDQKPTFLVNREQMVEFAREVRSRGYDYPACISGVDWPDLKAPENSYRETVYHLRSMKTGEWVVLKARCPSTDPWLNSLFSVYRGADWNEREVYDLYGIEFRGHPDLRRILMPEDWTGHPLLKSYRMSTYYSPAGNERQK